MAKPSSTLWGIHAGKTGDADQLFLKHNVIALGWVDVGELIFQHYEQFDSRYKALLPLKRVYVPEPLEESD